MNTLYDVCVADRDESTSLTFSVKESGGVDCTSILSTKFNIPQPRIDLISRSHLIAKIDDSVTRGHILTLICAPAGFGKTTLLGDWISHSHMTTHLHNGGYIEKAETQHKASIGWVSLDEGDDNQVRFWSAIITAIQVIDANIGVTALAALKSPQPPNFNAILTVLINDITNQLNLTHRSVALSPAVIFIDDYHFIKNPEIHKGFSFLISHLPQGINGLHIVMSTRVEPPILLHRLRARAQITEIRSNDMRFTYEETSAFYNQVMDFDLLPEQIEAMETRTEGWVAGLQLAAVTMQAMLSQEHGPDNSQDFTAFINAFTGSSRYVLDYLAEEILSRQSDKVQQFLLKTSILDKMTGSLCDTVLATSGSDTMLHRLEQSNLFIVSLDQNRIWYRYHRLFVEFLRAHLKQTSRTSLSDVNDTSIQEGYYRASIWCESHGMLSEAVQYALDGQCFIKGARLIENSARTLLMQGEARCLLDWADALPVQLIESRPRLYLAKLWALVTTGQLDVAQSNLNWLVALDNLEKDSYAGEISAIQGFIYILKGNVHDGLVYAEKAMDLLTEEDIFLRGLVALNMGRAYDILGEIESASLVYTEALKLGKIMENTLVNLVALSQLGDVKVLQGNLNEAEEIYFKALRLAEHPGGQQPLAGLAYAGLGIVHYERNSLDSAEVYLLERMRLGQQWENTDVSIYSMVHLAWVNYAKDKTTAVRALMDEIADDLDGQIVSQPTISYARSHLARLALRMGDSHITKQWLENYTHDSPSTPNDLAHTQLVTWAQISIIEGQSSAVIQKLVPLIETIKAKGLVHYEIELMALVSAAYENEGMFSLAGDIMKSARNRGSKQGYARVYIDNAAKVNILRSNDKNERDRKVFSGWRIADVELPLADKTVRRKSDLPTRQENKPIALLLDPLSRREEEVLQLLSSGLSNKEISQTLFIAVGTVKQHLKNIYSKFDVHNRTEAVMHAQVLGML